MKETVGIVEKIRVIGSSGKEALALVDTGAKLTSVDIDLAAETGIGPVKRTTRIKSAAKDPSTRRAVLEATIEICGKKFKTEVNINDRSHMTFPVLIGRNILRGNFVVDVDRNKELFKKTARNRNSLSEYE